MSEHRCHEHAGGTSQDMMDAASVLNRAGVGAGDVLLDAGCGFGHFSLAAARLAGKKGRVYAVDVFEEGLDKLRRDIRESGVDNIEVLKADMTRDLPLPPSSCDWILMVNVLHGLAANREFSAAMRAFGPLVKPDGRLLVVDFDKRESRPGPPVEIRLSPEEAVRAFGVFGYGERDRFRAGPNHYGLVLNRTDRG